MGPLHGLPTLHKDLQPTNGIRTTFGSRIFRDFIPEQDFAAGRASEPPARSCWAETNTPEFGAGSQTYNEVFGATLNPFDTTKTCGGSSGGAAVSLACHMVPIADGTDLGGSLRNPASFCNVVGLRPSQGRVRVRPAAGACELSVEGPIKARSRGGSCFLLFGNGGDPIRPSHNHWAGDFKGVRIALVERSSGGIPHRPTRA